MKFVGIGMISLGLLCSSAAYAQTSGAAPSGPASTASRTPTETHTNTANTRANTNTANTPANTNTSNTHANTNADTTADRTTGNAR